MFESAQMPQVIGLDTNRRGFTHRTIKFTIVFEDNSTVSLGASLGATVEVHIEIGPEALTLQALKAARTAVEEHTEFVRRVGRDEENVDEVFASAGESADTFDQVLSELETLMMDEELNAKMDAFTSEHCHEFDDGDENKLVYTSLFQQYTTLVETYIEERLGASVASFDMASFCTQLQERAAAIQPVEALRAE